MHAVIVTKPDARVTAEGVREHCRAHIARYKCPKSVESRAQMPLSGAEKILERDLHAPYRAGKGKTMN